MSAKSNKRGPKPKITDTAEREIFAVLAVGGSLNDAADYIGIDRATLNRRMASDAKFAKGVDRAVSKGKLRHLKKIGKNAQPWQASAWMLERKWGAEFGKREAIEHTGKDGGPIKTAPMMQIDMEKFVTELARELERSAADRAILERNGNNESVHREDAASAPSDLSRRSDE